MLSQTPRERNSVQQPRLGGDEEDGNALSPRGTGKGSREPGALVPRTRKNGAAHRRGASLAEAADAAMAMNAMSFANLMDAYAPTVDADAGKATRRDASPPKNDASADDHPTSAAARKKTSTNHPRDEEKLTTSRRGLDV